MKISTDLTPENIALALQAVLEGNKQSDKATLLQEMLFEEFNEKRKEKDEQRKMAIEIQRQNGQAMEKAKNERELVQEHCPHTKPNGSTNVVGQRDHSANYHWFCQQCQKEWLNSELPAYLAVPAERVGGPHAG